MPLILICSGITTVFAGPPITVAVGPDGGLAPEVHTYGFRRIPYYSNEVMTHDSFFADDPSFMGGIRVAMGNVVSTTDVITGRGPGATALVKVFTGSNLVYSMVPFGTNFTLGVFVAAGDVNGDGHADIIVGAGDGTGSTPRVKVVSGADGVTVLHDFLAFSPSFQGGVRVAAGDVNGDGYADIICGSGPGGAEVAVYSGKDLTPLKAFTAYPGFSGGIFVAAGDVNRDGRDDIITGPGTSSSNVKVFNATDNSVIYSFLAFDPRISLGARVAASDVTGDGVPDILVGTSPGQTCTVIGFDGTDPSRQLSPVGTPYGTATKGVFAGGIPRFPPRSVNISTRANVLTGDNVVIAGFVMDGTDAKDIIIRGLGPSTGVPGALADPYLELYRGNTLIATNNDWKDTQQITIEQTLAPSDDRESAIVVAKLAPGAYTAILRGFGGSTGIGLVEVYDLATPPSSWDSKFANLSTRGFVQTGNNVMIAGFIVNGGTGTNRVVVRGLGPSLKQFGVTNALGDPTLGLYNAQGTLLRGNDNWKESQQSDIQATGLAPSNDVESALLVVLANGSYTAIVAGTGGALGVGLVEVYNLQ